MRQARLHCYQKMAVSEKQDGLNMQAMLNALSCVSDGKTNGKRKQQVWNNPTANMSDDPLQHAN